MKNAIIALLLILLFSSPGFSSPILPASKSMLFDGIFQWQNDEGDYFERSIYGTIDFNLIYQIDWPQYDYLDWVRWSVEIKTLDGLFAASGFLDNEEAVMLTGNPTVLGGCCWDVFGSVTQSYVDTDFLYFFGGAEFASTQWDLITNNNFLPTELWFSAPNDLYNEELYVYLSTKPVPEPGTITLFAMGFIGIFFSRKLIRDKHIVSRHQ